MKLYELNYLIDPELSREELTSLQDRINSFIQAEEGNIKSSNPPYKKILAYSIKKKREAFLVDLIFEINPENIIKLEKKLKSEKQILRHLVYKKEITKKKAQSAIRRKIVKKDKVELKEIEKKLEEILGN